MDCYVQCGQEFLRGIEYLHYAVTDIWEPSYFNVARAYEFKGKVEREEWMRPLRRALT